MASAIDENYLAPELDSIISTFALSRFSIALIWIYHGLVPKILFRHVSELELVAMGPIFVDAELTIVIAGVVEVSIGLLVLIFWKQVWPIVISLAGFSVLLLGAIALSPELAIQAFNPVTLTVSAIMFCLIQFQEMKKCAQASDE